MRQATIRKQQIVCLIIVFVAIAICGGAFLTLSVIAKSEFWEASHLQNAQIDISEYGDSIRRTYEDQRKRDQPVL